MSKSVQDILVEELYIDYRALTKEILDHIEERQPHSAVCSVCGEELAIVKKYMDVDGDLSLEIRPCKCNGDQE